MHKQQLRRQLLRQQQPQDRLLLQFKLQLPLQEVLAGKFRLLLAAVAVRLAHLPTSIILNNSSSSSHLPRPWVQLLEFSLSLRLG